MIYTRLAKVVVDVVREPRARSLAGLFTNINQVDSNTSTEAMINEIESAARVMETTVLFSCLGSLLLTIVWFRLFSGYSA